jgi:hypothetical protein
MNVNAKLAAVERTGAVATPVVVELYGNGRSPSPLDPFAAA